MLLIHAVFFLHVGLNVTALSLLVHQYYIALLSISWTWTTPVPWDT
jgi:hypothetical protein